MCIRMMKAASSALFSSLSVLRYNMLYKCFTRQLPLFKTHYTTHCHSPIHTSHTLLICALFTHLLIMFELVNDHKVTFAF